MSTASAPMPMSSGSVPLVRSPAAVFPLVAAFSVLAVVVTPGTGRAIIAAITAATVVLVAATDLERRIIPNRVVLPATALAFAVCLLSSPGAVPAHLAAAALAALLLLMPRLITREAVGMGDVKLVALLGIALGWAGLGAMALAFLALSPVALVALIRGGRRQSLPFGPFLAVGALCVMVLPHL